MSNATELLSRALDAWDDEGTFDYLGTMDCLMEDIRAFLAAEPEASALQRYKDCCKEGEPETPIERLRFFCSFAMKGQDWLDVEQFFDGLAAEPEAEPVTDEPVAFCDLTLNGKSIAYFEGKPIIMVGNVGNACHPYALYLHPPKPEPARKPMTEEEAKELCPFTREEFKAGFLTGIRFAEKHHGISGEDQ